MTGRFFGNEEELGVGQESSRTTGLVDHEQFIIIDLNIEIGEIRVEADEA